MAMMKMVQSLDNKVGEVSFRRELVLQHLGQKSVFEGQPDKTIIWSELKKRIIQTKQDFEQIVELAKTKGPFLEIGAEKCQRAMYLENEVGLRGLAGDISWESLKSADGFKKKLGYQKMPVRVCLDAYQLPFQDNSLPLILFYETLHHFPDPKPVLDEALRVLAVDGVLFFGDEPVKQLVNLRLWRRDFRLSWVERLLKACLILPFLSTIGKSEVEHGILEETFGLETWLRAISRYSQARVWLKPYLIGQEKLMASTGRGRFKVDLLTKLLLAIQGGGIRVVAKAKKSLTRVNPKLGDLVSLFACPNCISRPGLKHDGQSLVCAKCHSHYEQRGGVWMLLPRQIKQILYA